MDAPRVSGMGGLVTCTDVSHSAINYYSSIVKGLSTGRGHATPHMPIETAKCWWLLNKCVGGWQRQCVDLQAVGTLEFFGELYSLAKGFGPFLRGVGQALEKGRVLSLVTTSTSLSLQAYAELHALSPLRGSISPCP